jgi:hypothetical protein
LELYREQGKDYEQCEYEMKSSVTFVTEALKALPQAAFQRDSSSKTTVTEPSLLSPEVSLEGGTAIAIHHDEHSAIRSTENIINRIQTS